MTPRARATTAALTAMLAVLSPRPAQAAERACPGMRVETDAAFRSRYLDLIQRIHSEFSARTDLDACARVTLGLEDDTVIHVSVTLPDGRAASRSVTRDDDVLPTLQALLVVPDPSPTAPTAPAAPPAKRPTSPAARPSVPAARRAPHLDSMSRPASEQSPAATTARDLGVELSFFTGARLGDGQFGVGAGVLSFLELQGWLFGFEGRLDSYRAIEGSDPDTALEVALLAGRRFDLGSVALDVLAGPAVAIKGFGTSEVDVRHVEMAAPEMPPPNQSEASSGPLIQSEPSSGAVPRLLLAARLGFSPRSVFRTFVGIDGEVGPAQADSGGGRDSARLPAFSVGLALGATVGTP